MPTLIFLLHTNFILFEHVSVFKDYFIKQTNLNFTICTLDVIDVNWPILTTLIPPIILVIADIIAEVYNELGPLSED